MPDITNDFDNNPNTDKRKQRDEEVNNDNLQPEQTKSEPELLEQTKSKGKYRGTRSIEFEPVVYLFDKTG